MRDGHPNVVPGRTVLEEVPGLGGTSVDVEESVSVVLVEVSGRRSTIADKSAIEKKLLRDEVKVEDGNSVDTVELDAARSCLVARNPTRAVQNAYLGVALVHRLKNQHTEATFEGSRMRTGAWGVIAIIRGDHTALLLPNQVHTIHDGWGENNRTRLNECSNTTEVRQDEQSEQCIQGRSGCVPHVTILSVCVTVAGSVAWVSCLVNTVDV